MLNYIVKESPKFKIRNLFRIFALRRNKKETMVNTLDLDLNKRYTYKDYLTWIDDKRRELYDGFIKMMSPAPKRMHQNISSFLHIEIGYFLKKKRCKIFAAPFDIRLPKKGNEEIYDVVQPDLSIICDPKKLDENGCLGAPDMIIEIISKATAKRDAIEKYKIYEEAGVREYWIVYPETELVHVFLLKENKYELKQIYANDDKIEVNIFNGELIINLKEVFENIE